jgi:hypothetical protein
VDGLRPGRLAQMEFHRHRDGTVRQDQGAVERVAASPKGASQVVQSWASPEEGRPNSRQTGADGSGGVAMGGMG